MNLEAIKAAIEHYEYGVSHDIFSEPVTTYAKTAIAALREAEERREGRADVAPVVHGKWLFIANGVEAPECSVCGWAVFSRDFEYRSGLPPYHKYCGHCGAKLERSDT